MLGRIRIVIFVEMQRYEHHVGIVRFVEHQVVHLEEVVLRGRLLLLRGVDVARVDEHLQLQRALRPLRRQDEVEAIVDIHAIASVLLHRNRLVLRGDHPEVLGAPPTTKKALHVVPVSTIRLDVHANGGQPVRHQRHLVLQILDALRHLHRPDLKIGWLSFRPLYQRGGVRRFRAGQPERRPRRARQRQPERRVRRARQRNAAGRGRW